MSELDKITQISPNGLLPNAYCWVSPVNGRRYSVAGWDEWFIDDVSATHSMHRQIATLLQTHSSAAVARFVLPARLAVMMQAGDASSRYDRLHLFAPLRRAFRWSLRMIRSFAHMAKAKSNDKNGSEVAKKPTMTETEAVQALWEAACSTVTSQLHRCGYGNHDAAWLSFYWVFKDHVQEVNRLAGLWDLARVCGWWWPFNGAVILTKRPLECHVTDGRLHKDGGPAICYEDGFSVYALNGVRVPEWLAATPTGDIDPKKMVELDNAEIRREFVRKVGMERICQAMEAESLDKAEFNGLPYELLKLKVNNNTTWTFLKMENPSIHTWHVEGVPNNCRTVREAIMFRNGLSEAMIDDKDGLDYFQHGDVLLFPESSLPAGGTKKVKLQPAKLH